MQTHGPEVYRSIPHAVSSIVRTEGFCGLYTGLVPTATRATALGAAELSSYDEVKQCLLSSDMIKSEGFVLHLVSSLLSGLIATAVSTPFDFAKSRIMNYVPLSGGGLVGPLNVKYSGMLDCMLKSVRAEGVHVLWSGFWATYIRLGPNITITFVIMEQLKIVFEGLPKSNRNSL